MWLRVTSPLYEQLLAIFLWNKDLDQWEVVYFNSCHIFGAVSSSAAALFTLESMAEGDLKLQKVVKSSLDDLERELRGGNLPYNKGG